MNRLLALAAVFFVVSWDQPEVFYGVKYDASGHAVYLDWEGPPMAWQVRSKRATVRAETLEEAQKAADAFGPDRCKVLDLKITRVEETELPSRGTKEKN